MTQFDLLQLYVGADGNPPYGPDGDLAENGGMIRTDWGSFPKAICRKPQAQPKLAATYFVVFIFIAAFILLSIFIGAVCSGMAESMDEYRENAEKETQASEAKSRALAVANEFKPK